MSIYLELPPDVEARLTSDAENQGADPASVVRALVEKAYPPRLTVAHLLTLPRKEQDRLMAAAIKDAAPLYEADLALPPMEREITSFSALDGVEPIIDGFGYTKGRK